MSRLANIWLLITRFHAVRLNPRRGGALSVFRLAGAVSLVGMTLISSAADQASGATERMAKPAYDLTADSARKAAMPPEEAAWETVLEQNLGDFYLPLYKRDKLQGRQTPWDFVQNDPKLPRILLIGDSISRGYTLAVRHRLAGKVNVHRAPANCGPTATGLKRMSAWLGDGKWDLIHFNFGIHDRNTEGATYAANLEQIIAELRKTGAKLIWARTTPPASSENAERYSPEQCDELNRIADGIMQRHAIAMNDLYSLVRPRLSELLLTNNVHFNSSGYEMLGRGVANAILEALGSTVRTSSPAQSSQQVNIGLEKPIGASQHGAAAQAESQHAFIGVAAATTNITLMRHADTHWFPQAGLGMFIHWGLASIPGNLDLSWGMMKNTRWDLHLQNTNKLAPAAYFALAPQFKPTNFCPERWLGAAKEAGFRYAVLTTRHHDGFALWPSKFGDFNIAKFHPGRDLVREYVEACRKAGLRIGFYYSPPDWYYHRLYQSWGYGSKGTPESPHLGLDWEPLSALPKRPPGFDDQYLTYVNGQITELLTWYGQIDYLWFDGSAGPKVLTQEQIRSLQPDIIINDRQHGIGDVATSDYECKVPTNRPAGWWEHCFSMIGAWGYTKPENYSPTSRLIDRLAQVRSMGGNVLANYGPRPDGEMPEAFYKQMAELKRLQHGAFSPQHAKASRDVGP